MLVGCRSSEQPATREQPVGRAPGSYHVYVGTFTGKASKGIYLLEMDAASGALSGPELVGEAPSPSYLALHPNFRLLYAVNEVGQLDGRPGGAVSAFSIDAASGKLALLNRQPSAGADPTHITIDNAGRNVFVANYGSGSVAVLPVGDDGALSAPSSIHQHRGRGTDPQRQEGPHAHCANPDPQNRFVLSCDLGLDKVFVYRFDAARHAIELNDPPTGQVAPGAGPRHLAFHPSGRFVYVINEMACTITGFSYDAEHGVLSEFRTVSTLPTDFSGKDKSCAEIAVHPSGKFVYASNRGDANSLAAFKVDQATGTLTLIGHVSTQGRTPRGFGIDPTGRWLIAANQDTDNVVVFRINSQTGQLTPTGINVGVPTPVCITFVPREK